MRTYLKILSITAGLQLLGLVLTLLMDRSLDGSGPGMIWAVFVGGFFLLLSMAVGIILPIKWCVGTSRKILTILLLPTNHTWSLLVIAVVKFVQAILGILEDLPPNFG